MSQLYNKVSYIVCYREASNERKKALLYTIRRFRQYFPSIEILIVEQDSESKLTLDKSLNVRHLFIYNAGLFNRSWAFNCAVKNSTKDIFVFVDGDIFLEKEDYIKCFNATKEFEAITPNKIEISNVFIDEDANNEVQFLNMRKLHTFAGGMLIMTRIAFEKICGWDERFEGWGGEDDAMTHVIYNRLKSVTFNLPNYHIDHPHENVTGDNHPKYEANNTLWREIISRNGPSLDRYIQQLKTLDLGNSERYSPSYSVEKSEKLTFVLAITTYNRLEYLKGCVESFLKTKNDIYSWHLIIADDGSTDETQEYLKKLEKDHEAIIIRNNRTNIHHQVNTIIKTLTGMTFDLCFKCDDDIQFLQKGWDDLYWETIHRTGYHHLIFYDKNWQPHSNLSRPIRFGSLISNCLPEQIQGAFYTLTKDVIDRVGYFDEQKFGASGLGHVDFSFRSCRAGFNVLANPFDVEHSNEYIQLQAVHSYQSATSLKEKSDTNTKNVIALKKQLLTMSRDYIPHNEHIVNDDQMEANLKIEHKSSKKRSLSTYQKADATYYPERGIGGFVGFVLKRFYNLSIDLRFYFIPNTIKFLGKTLNKISIHLLNIEQ